MRITNQIIQRETIAQMQKGLRDVAEAQRKVTTGVRVAKPSDDPTAAAGIMHSGSSLRALEQYRRNIGSATSRAASEEGVLNQLTDVLSRAQELAVTAGGPVGGSNLPALKAEVDQLLNFAVELGNTRHGEVFLFGGNQVEQQPFQTTTPPFASAPLTGVHTTEISSGHRIVANHNGQEVFLDTGALQSLRDLSDALGAGDTNAVRTAAGNLKNSFEGVQDLLSDVGARVSQMQVTTANLDALEVNLRTFKSDLEDVDLEKAVTELVGRQTAVQAAMLATSKVMGLTLTDYLR